MFTSQEITTLIDALNMKIASSKRMQSARPKFSAVFQDEINECTSLIAKVTNADKAATGRK